MLGITDYLSTPLTVLAAIAFLTILAVLIGIFLSSLEQTNHLRSIDRSLKTLPTVKNADNTRAAIERARKSG